MAQDLALRVLLTAQDQASGVAKGFGSTLINLAGDAGPLLKVFGGIAAGAIAVGAVSVKMAGDFDQAMRKNVAEAGLSQDKMGEWSAAILKMAPEVGKAPLELAKGLFFVMSHGIDSAHALDVLRYSARLAAEGMTTTDITSVALSKNMEAFGVTAKQAADIITVAVSKGAFTMDQYSKTIGKLGLDASLAGRNIYETHAALDVLSYSFRSAATAGTGLSQLYTQMDIKTETMAGKFNKLHTSVSKYSYTVSVLKDKHGQLVHVLEHLHGVSKNVSDAFDVHAFKTMNLAQQIAYLNKITGGNREELLKMFSGSKLALEAFESLKTKGGQYASILDALKKSTKGAGAESQAWAITQGGFNQTMARVKAGVDAFLITLGEHLLPILTQIAQAIIPIIGKLSEWIDFISKNQTAQDILKAALVGFAVMVGLIVIPAFWAWATAAAAAAVAQLALIWPILLVGAVVAVVVLGIIQAVRHWGAIIQWVGNIFHVIGDAIHKDLTNAQNQVGAVFSAIGTFVHEKFDQIVGFAKTFGIYLIASLLGPAGIILALIITHWTQIKTFISTAWNTIVSRVQQGMQSVVSAIVSAGINIWNAITAPFKKAYDWITGLFSGLGGVLHNVLANMPLVGGALHGLHIPGFSTGVQNFSGGMALVGERGPELVTLPGGSSVYPMNGIKSGFPSPSYTSSSSSGGGSPIYITIYAQNASAKEVAYEVEKILSGKLRRSGTLSTITSGGKVAS